MIICTCYSQNLPKWSGPANLGVKWCSASHEGGLGETLVGTRISGDQSQSVFPPGTNVPGEN